MGEVDHRDNPAGRLHIAFDAMKAQHNRLCRDVLSEYYSVSDGPSLLEHHAALCRLPAETLRRADALDLPSQMYRHVDKFSDTLVDMNMADTVGNQTRNIHAAQMEGMETLSAMFSKLGGDRVLDREAATEISQLLDGIDAALAEDDGELPDTVSGIVERCVSEMRRALSMRIILGTDPLLDEVHRSIGSIALSDVDFTQYRAVKAVRLYFEMTGFVASTLDIYDRLAALGVADILALTSGG